MSGDSDSASEPSARLDCSPWSLAVVTLGGRFVVRRSIGLFTIQWWKAVDIRGLMPRIAKNTCHVLEVNLASLSEIMSLGRPWSLQISIGEDSGRVSSSLRAYLERHKVCHLGESINNDPKLIMAIRERQSRDEVH